MTPARLLNPVNAAPPPPPLNATPLPQGMIASLMMTAIVNLTTRSLTRHHQSIKPLLPHSRRRMLNPSPQPRMWKHSKPSTKLHKRSLMPHPRLHPKLLKFSKPQHLKTSMILKMKTKLTNFTLLSVLPGRKIAHARAGVRRAYAAGEPTRLAPFRRERACRGPALAISAPNSPQLLMRSPPQTRLNCSRSLHPEFTQAAPRSHHL